MARFGIERPGFGLTGETFQRQGVVDNSKATMINAVAEQVVPVATAVQQQNLADDLNEIENGFEAQLQEDKSNPAVQGLEAELKRLNNLKGRMSETQYEARKAAALKRRINQTPGLAGALNQTAAQFDSLNEYSLVQQSFAAQKAAKTEYDDMVAYGVNKLGLPPTWTQDPQLIKYAEVRSRQNMQAAMDTDLKKSLELLKSEEGYRKDIDDRVREVETRLVANDLSGKHMQFVQTGYNVTMTGKDGQPMNVNAMDASQWRTLDSAQRLALQDQLKTDFLREQALLTAKINDGTIDATMLNPQIESLANMYNTMIGFGSLEDTAKLIQNEEIIINTPERRELTKLDLQYKLKDVNYNIQELDTLRAGQIQQKQMELNNTLSDLEVKGRMLSNPHLLKLRALNTLLPQTMSTVDVQLQIDKIMDGSFGDERDSAFQVGDVAQWQTHIAKQTEFYARMNADLATPASASVVADTVSADMLQLRKSIKNQINPLSLEELGDWMNVYAQEGYGKLAQQFTEEFGDVGVEMEQLIMPIVTRDVVRKAQSLYAEGGTDFNVIFKVENGQFSIGGKVVEGANTRSDDNGTMIVKSLNNAAKAIANTQNIPIEEATQKVLGMMPKTEMYNMIEGQFRNTIRMTNAGAEGFLKAEQDIRTAFNGLFGEGAFLDYHRQKLTSQGYQEIGPTPKGNGIVFQLPDGTRKVVGEHSNAN